VTSNGSEPRALNLRAVQDFFRFMHEKNIEAWATLWDRSARITVPYPPAGFPSAIEGADQIVRGFRDLFSHFGTYDYEIRALYPTLDPDTIIVEWDVAATLPARHATYRGNNITVFRMRDGKIAEYHDYFDPRKFQTVVDALSDR
jgi:ketosteroid isomerase-like protein